MSSKRFTRFLASAAVSILVLSVWPWGGIGARGQNRKPVRIQVVDYPRPIAAAVRQIEQQFGWIVTYEDSRYVHPGDIVDVTEQVRRDHTRSNRILQMRSGNIDFAMTPQSASVEYQVAEILDRLFLDSNAKGNAGEFGAIRADGGYHVVPIAIRGRRGLLQEYSSPLDARITLPYREESALEMVVRFADAVSDQSGTTVGPGTMPLNRLNQTRVAVSAQNDVARDVLWRALRSIGDDLSWQMLCSVGEEGACAITLHSVRRK